MKTIIREVTFERASRKKDKSVSLSFNTALEQTPEQFMEMDRLIDSGGILYYSDKGNLTQQEIDELDKVDIELEGKTKSQRLRNVIYVMWTQSDKSKTKEEFYSWKMEVITEHLKNQLQDV